MAELSGIYKQFQHWNTQTCWIYSDPHFGDEDLQKKISGRPNDEEQIKLINSCTGRKDTLIILGDIGNIECVRKLRAARKILIMGNHDSGTTKYKRKIETFYYDKDEYTREEVKDLVMKQYPNFKISIEDYFRSENATFNYWVVKVDNCLFDEVYEGALIVGEKLIFSHEPVEIPWLYNIHGHDHSGHKRPNHLNVCSDVIGYKPINLNQWLKSGALAHTQTIHRATIDAAIERKAKRGGKKL